MDDFIENVLYLLEHGRPDGCQIRRCAESRVSYWFPATGSFSVHWQTGLEGLELRHNDVHVYLTDEETEKLGEWVQRDIYANCRGVAEEQFARAVAEVFGA